MNVIARCHHCLRHIRHENRNRVSFEQSRSPVPYPPEKFVFVAECPYCKDTKRQTFLKEVAG